MKGMLVKGEQLSTFEVAVPTACISVVVSAEDLFRRKRGELKGS